MRPKPKKPEPVLQIGRERPDLGHFHYRNLGIKALKAAKEQERILLAKGYKWVSVDGKTFKLRKA